MSEIDSLIRALADSDPEARAAAVEALGRLRDVRAVGSIAQALIDLDPAVRRKAEEALRQTEEGRAVMAIVEAVQFASAFY